MMLYFAGIMVNPSKIRQLLAIVIVLASLALAAAIALKTFRGMRSGPILPGLPKNIDVALQKIHYTETKNGEKKWDLLADRAEFDKTRDVIRLSNVRLDVAMSGKLKNIVLTSAQADYHTGTKNVELSGGVIAKSSSGMKFTTDKVAYISSRSLLRTADRVEFADGNLKVEGVGMELMVDTKILKINKQVTASYGGGALKP